MLVAEGTTGFHKADACMEPDFLIQDEAKGWKWEHLGGAY